MMTAKFDYYCDCRKKPFRTFKGFLRHYKEVHPCKFYGFVEGYFIIATRGFYDRKGAA